MGFTNITPGCTGFHSSSLCPCHSFSLSFLWVKLSIVHYSLFCGLLKKNPSFLLSFSILLSPIFVATLLCFEMLAETGVSTERDAGFQCWIGWSLPPFLTARQAPVFHLKRLWIYAVNSSHLSSVNHLGAGYFGSPHPQADGWPAGESEWKPAKPDASEALSRYHTERERTGQQSNSACVYQRPENSFAANWIHVVICSWSKAKFLFVPDIIVNHMNLALKHTIWHLDL